MRIATALNLISCKIFWFELIEILLIFSIHVLQYATFGTSVAVNSSFEIARFYHLHSSIDEWI